MENLFKNFFEIIASFTEAYTVAFFETENDYLYLKYFFSLSNNLKPNVKIKIGESILGWIAKHKKPINIKGDKFSHKILQIYNKDEDIKSYFILPVGNNGVIYLDTKRSYSITEKNQKILFYCANFLIKLLNFTEKEKEYIKLLKVIEFIKKFNYKDFLNFICNYFKFSWGIIIKRKEENFFIITSNNQEVKNIELNPKSKISIFLKKNLNKVLFIKDSYLDDSCILYDSDSSLNIKNFLIIPFLSHNIVIGAIILINGNINNEKELINEINILKKIFELKFFEEVFKFEAYKKESKIINIEKYLNSKESYSNQQVIYLKLKSYYKLLDKFSENIITNSIVNLFLNLKKAFKIDFKILKISPDSYGLLLNNESLKKIKNFIEKNFKNSYLNISNTQVSVKFLIYFFYNQQEFLKFILN